MNINRRKCTFTLHNEGKFKLLYSFLKRVGLLEFSSSSILIFKLKICFFFCFTYISWFAFRWYSFVLNTILPYFTKHVNESQELIKLWSDVTVHASVKYHYFAKCFTNQWHAYRSIRWDVMVHASVNFHYFTKCFTNQWHTLTPQGQGPKLSPQTRAKTFTSSFRDGSPTWQMG